MKSIVGVVPLLAVVVSFLGCASAMKPVDFAGGAPPFDPIAFFTGMTTSSGVQENRGGTPVKRVTTRTSGHLERDVLHLEQDLQFGTDKPQHRSWQIRRIDAQRYEATANDIIGTARGEAHGNVFHWRFTVARSPGNPLKNVRVSQWMHLQPDGRTMIIHSTIRKFGVAVGQVTEQFVRASATASQP
ncbi:MAG TPA: DUF3833 family protein [Vicinamibacterales bacterium]|nr:DUF3833 family protein [Vicinamibacterales bacterium]